MNPGGAALRCARLGHGGVLDLDSVSRFLRSSHTSRCRRRRSGQLILRGVDVLKFGRSREIELLTTMVPISLVEHTPVELDLLTAEVIE